MYRANRNRFRRNANDTGTETQPSHDSSTDSSTTANSSTVNNTVNNSADNNTADNNRTVNHKDDTAKCIGKECTPVKETIDDSVRAHKHTAAIEMPLTDDKARAKETNDRKDALEKKALDKKVLDTLTAQSHGAVPTGLLDKSLLTTTLSDDALMAYKLVSGSSNYMFHDYYSAFSNPFHEYVCGLYQSGDISYKNITIDFGSSNYTNTTLYKRAQYNGSTGMLVAGDMILFTIETALTGDDAGQYARFNVGFYINEVMTKDDNDVQTVQSKIKTGILEKPSPTVLYEGGTDVLSTAKDTNGNVYVVKKNKTVSDVTTFLQTVTKPGDTPYETLDILEPTNMSESTGQINTNPNYENRFKNNRLEFSSRYGADMLTVPHPSASGDVVLPDSFPSEDNVEGTKDNIKTFDCYVKGYFFVYRVGVKEGVTPSVTSLSDSITQTYSFEMNEYSHMQCEVKTDYVILKTDWFTANIPTSTGADNKLYLNKYNSNITAPFCATGGFFTTNCTDDNNNNIFTIETLDSDDNDDDKVKIGSKFIGFSILSQNKFIGDQNYQVIMETLGEEPLVDVDDVVKSQHVSNAIKSRKSTGCCIV